MKRDALALERAPDVRETPVARLVAATRRSQPRNGISSRGRALCEEVALRVLGRVEPGGADPVRQVRWDLSAFSAPKLAGATAGRKITGHDTFV